MRDGFANLPADPNRGKDITPRRSMASIAHALAGQKARFGSKPVNLRTNICFPVDPQFRTLALRSFRDDPRFSCSPNYAAPATPPYHMQKNFECRTDKRRFP